ncbi:MAG: type IV toxin-antitoxin system AbiEi family antitoxin domain-containing protein [Gemmatimonadota bacterium]
MPQDHSPTSPRGLGEQERSVLALLASLERPVVGADDVLARTQMGRKAVNLILSRLAAKGWLRRLRRGAYAVIPLSSRSGSHVIEQPLAAAMELFAPCYISGWTAAEHWDLTEQISNTVVVYSAKPQRKSEQTLGGVHYRVRRIPEAAIFGTTRIWSGTTPVEVADLHRTLIDVLDVPEMGGGGRQTLDIARSYWGRDDADADVLLALATRLGRGSVFKRLAFTAEQFGNPKRSWLDACRSRMSAGLTLWDPQGPKRGPIVSAWRLRVNVPSDDLT